MSATLHRPQAAPRARIAWRRLRRFPPPLAGAALALVVPLAVLAAWWGITAKSWVTPLVLPAPDAVLQALVDLTTSGDLASNLGTSLRRVLLGFALGAAAGLSVGALMGLSRTAELVLRPSLMAFVQVPVLAWIPLLMIPLGIGEPLKLAAIGMAAFTPMLVHTARGLRAVPPALIEVGRLYRLSWAQRLQYILLPSALPALGTGLRLALTQAWQSLVVVELVAATEGIGYMVVMARQMFQLDQMLAVMLVIGVTGFVLDRLVRLAEAAIAARFGAVAA